MNDEKFHRKRKNEPLTNEEIFNLFLVPFFTPRPRWREDHYSASEMERFEKYGFDKKAKQATKVKAFGILFWFILIILGILIFN